MSLNWKKWNGYDILLQISSSVMTISLLVVAVSFFLKVIIQYGILLTNIFAENYE